MNGEAIGQKNHTDMFAEIAYVAPYTDAPIWLCFTVDLTGQGFLYVPVFDAMIKAATLEVGRGLHI